MFGFFKKKTKGTQIKQYEEQEDDNSKKVNTNIAAGFSTNETINSSVEQAAETFNKPQKYDRKLYDSGAAKVKAKKKLFSDNETVRDPYSNKELVLTKKEAKARFGNEWADHLAESDHIKPLKDTYDEHRNNPWLSNDDIRNATNSDENIKVTSRKYNNAKRDKTNEEYVNDEAYLAEKNVHITDEGKELAIRDGQNAESAINTKLRKSSVKNAVETGHKAGIQGAKNAGLTVVTMSGITNIVSVMKGEKKPEQAIKDVMKDGGKAAVAGYAISGGSTVVMHSLSNSSSRFMQALAKNNVPGKVLTAVMVTGGTLTRYAKGEINTEECIIELGGNTLNFATTGYAMAAGQALIPIPVVGAAIGALVGSALTSNYYNEMINTLKTRKLEEEERQRIINECNKAAEYLREYQKQLQECIDSYMSEFQDCFDTALSDIRTALENGDADGVISGANKITKKLGGQVQYETVEEFAEFLDSDEEFIL